MAEGVAAAAGSADKSKREGSAAAATGCGAGVGAAARGAGGGGGAGETRAGGSRVSSELKLMRRALSLVSSSWAGSSGLSAGFFS